MFNETATFKRIVQERALDLKNEGKGYLQTLNIIADELYRTDKGEETPISRKSITEFKKLPKIPGSYWIELIRNSWKVYEYIKNKKKEKDSVIKNIKDKISPWVSEVYEKNH
jgi:hypothetical protein